MEYSVCRPIVLYNDFLPPDVEPHRNWGYLAFGYFDGIMIGKNLFQNGGYSLEQLWLYELEQTEALEGKYSAQVLFGFRCEDELCSYDEEFWEEALRENTPYPFVFVTMLQGDIKKEKAAIEYRKLLEKSLTEDGRRKAITYLTLDNNSLILVLMCREYGDGATLIDMFHRKEEVSPLREIGLKLTYSFTVAAVQRCFLNKDQAIKDVHGAPIEHVYVYAIEKKPGSIEEICRSIQGDLGKEVCKESILGCNDEVIIIDDVSWPVFLKWFQDKKGILNHSSAQYGEKLIGITTIIGQPQAFADNSSLHEKTSKQGQYYRYFSKDLKRMIEEIGGEIDPRYRNLERYLRQTINALQKFEDTPIPDYIFCSMFLSIRMVLEILKERRRVKILREDFFTCFYEFVKALNLCVQNSIRSDRQFIQSLDFNIRIYSTPVRLNAFYNAFIYNMKKFLNTMGDVQEKNEYEFLTCLGIMDTVQVNELFKNMMKGKRLFLVSIPENQTYDMRLMLIMLGHEVGHFVGQTVRNREERVKDAIRITAKITTSYFKLKLKEQREYAKQERSDYIQNSGYWDKFENRLSRRLSEQMDNFQKVDYLKEKKYPGRPGKIVGEIGRMHKEYGMYTHVLRETLVDGVSDVLCEHREELFDFLLEKEYLYQLSQGEEVSGAAKGRQRLSEEMGNLIKVGTGYSVWEKKSLSVVSAVNMMMSFFKECEADLVAILVLELSLEDYLYAIWKSVWDQGIKDWEMPEEATIRIGLVVSCMCYHIEDGQKGFYWSDKQFEQIEEGVDDRIRKMNVQIINFIDSYLGEDNQDIIVQKANQTVDVFLDSTILKLLLGYLVRCRDTFRNMLEGQGRDDVTNSLVKRSGMQKQLKNIYNQCKEKNVEELIWNMQKYIEDYKQQLQVEIAACGNQMMEAENE